MFPSPAKIKNRAVLGRFLAASLALSACIASQSRAEDATFNVIDDRGVAVSVPAKPKRIASVSYFAADVALALGLKPVAATYMVEGRSPDFLGGHLDGVRQIGQRATPNLELLAEAKPDVTVAIRRYTEGNADQYQKIAPYLGYSLELFADSDRTIGQLATILGETKRGQELNAQFKADLAAFAEKAPKDKHPRFVVMWGGDTPWVFRSENMTAAILVALGAENIAGQNPTPSVPDNWGMEMSLETMLEKDPEVIFVYDYGPDRPHENNPIWQQLSAVKNGRVHYVGDHWVEAHGPIAREMVLREAAHLLYPDVFPAIDVKAEARKMIPASVN
ncbi:ABC transporter substrate-binding protein [Sinorhizobium americanum]|uniref:Periplasmic binding protein n=1 Tax=Sinorhizobium americanum TaxID=194963 RepID=A0A1L3LM53_9HYPH|nr:ABC transporter substrate-binding protein [Sinorhizobium americanum]APG91182.1 periplasmic binding protein [Sinorhizobium americanum]OAP45234.1 ferrichrome ABC transporter substrate-binding protein [Sinorhizobium americanum]